MGMTYNRLSTHDLLPQEALQVELHNAVVDCKLDEEKAIEEIRRCMKAGANLNYYQERTFLDAAFEAGRNRVAEELLKQGARLDFVPERYKEKMMSVYHISMLAFTDRFIERGEIDILVLLLRYDKKNYFETLNSHRLGTPRDMWSNFIKELHRSPWITDKMRDWPGCIEPINQLIDEEVAKRRAELAAKTQSGPWTTWLTGALSCFPLFSRAHVDYQPVNMQEEYSRLSRPSPSTKRE